MMKAAFNKYIVSIAFSLVFVLLITSCEPQVVLDNEIKFFVAKEWKLDKFYGSGILQTEADMSPGDKLTNYRLNLKEDFTFTRTKFDGSVEGGDWALTAGLSQLILFVNDTREEDYLLLNLEVRQLEIRLLQGLKTGQTGQWDIKYILVPVKRQ